MDIRRTPRIYWDTEKATRVITMADSEEDKDAICDFCSRKNPPYKSYDCKDFMNIESHSWSRGAWAACHTCADLIDSDDKEGLAMRSALMFQFEWGDKIKVPIEDLMAELRQMHGRFFANRIMPQSQSAPPEPISGQPESPGSHSSSHNQGGGFPDEDPSK